MEYIGYVVVIDYCGRFVEIWIGGRIERMSNAKRLDESLKTLEEGITKVKLIMDGYPASKLVTSEEYMRYYEYPGNLLWFTLFLLLVV